MRAWVVTLVLLLLLTPAAANADSPSAAGPTEICLDGVDNDGDQLADCVDPDCAGVPGCARPLSAIGGPTTGAGAASPGGRRSGALMGLGIVATSVGAIALLTSLWFWADGLDLLPGSGPGTSASDLREIQNATVLTLGGLVLVAGGIIAIRVGSARGPGSNTASAFHLHWAPAFSVDGHATTLGLVGRF